MICKKCGYKNRRSAMFCEKCGTRLKESKIKLSNDRTPDDSYDEWKDTDYDDDSGKIIITSDEKNGISKFLPIILGIIIVVLAVLFGKDLLDTFDKDDSDSSSKYDTVSNYDEEDEYNNGGDLDEQDYIIPYSSSRRLTTSDVEGLTKKEINYAKNEIYAKHGRRFDSYELQRYFNSKSWYHGTIDPEDFNEDIMFSNIEYENVLFLKRVENNM